MSAVDSYLAASAMCLPPELVGVIIRETIRLDEEDEWPFHCPGSSEAAQSVGTLSRAWAQLVRPLFFRRIVIHGVNSTVELLELLVRDKKLEEAVLALRVEEENGIDFELVEEFFGWTTQVQALHVVSLAGEIHPNCDKLQSECSPSSVLASAPSRL